MKTPHNAPKGHDSKAVAHTSGKGISLAAPQTIQMKRVGHTPIVPGAFRGTTTIGYDGTGVPQGGKAFNGVQTANVRTDNFNNGGGAAPVIAPGNHNVSDVGGGGLIERNMVSQLEPEVDHIVPVASGGANDFDNARVLSKTQNAPGAFGIPRPNAAQRSLRAYEDFTVGPTGGLISIVSNGDIMNANDAAGLATYAGVAPQVNPGAYTAANIATMIGAGNGTANGIDVA